MYIMDKNGPKIRRLRASLSAVLTTSWALDCRHRRKEQERRGGSSGVWEFGGDKWKYKEKNGEYRENCNKISNEASGWRTKY